MDETDTEIWAQAGIEQQTGAKTVVISVPNGLDRDLVEDYVASVLQVPGGEDAERNVKSKLAEPWWGDEALRGIILVEFGEKTSHRTKEAVKSLLRVRGPHCQVKYFNQTESLNPVQKQIHECCHAMSHSNWASFMEACVMLAIMPFDEVEDALMDEIDSLVLEEVVGDETHPGWQAYLLLKQGVTPKDWVGALSQMLVFVAEHKND